MTALPNITEMTDVAEDDLLYAYDQSAAASPDRRVKVSNLFKDRTLSGNSTADTPAAGDNSKRIATTAFVADRAQVVDPPATAASAGAPGQIAYDASYFYICIAANTWLRAAIATW